MNGSKGRIGPIDGPKSRHGPGRGHVRGAGPLETEFIKTEQAQAKQAHWQDEWNQVSRRKVISNQKRQERRKEMLQRLERPLPAGRTPSEAQIEARVFATANGASEVQIMFDLVKAKWQDLPPPHVRKESAHPQFLFRAGPSRWWICDCRGVSGTQD